MADKQPITVYELCTSKGDRARVLSPFAWRAVLAVAHKGFPMKRVSITFTEKDQIAFSKQKLVPVIVDPNNPKVPFVNDSQKIAHYLDEAYPDLPSLFGPSPQLTQFVCNWVNSVVNPFIQKLCFDDARMLQDDDGRDWYYSAERAKMFGIKSGSMPKPQVPREQIPQVIQEFRRALEPARGILRGSKFLGGETPLYCDYVLFSAFLWIRAVSATSTQLLEPSDPLFQWRARMLDLFGGLAKKSAGYHDQEGEAARL
ncbi:hypothetical protein DFJ74DRAFT_706715 [Hyaloraphidium curvatum]|nr:hypothetical protein DFJ74DRAFT_706715 [Hyaloraphidium curvatum]